MSAFSAALKQSITLLPLVTTATGDVIAKTASAAVNGMTAIDEGFAYGADYMSDIRQDQLALLELKQSYREIVKADAKDAVASRDKAVIIAAYKAMQTDFESID